jgi:predicted nucleic acid-binding Zn ribbon protein
MHAAGVRQCDSNALSCEAAMSGGRRKSPQQIGGAIQNLLARLDGDGHFEIVRLVRTWAEVVGETIARRTEVAGLKFHVATIKVSGAMWIQELNLMKPQILARLREAIGGDVVRDIRFVQGRMSRRERPRLRAVPRGVRHAIELPELKDPELRRAFERLIEAWGRAPR